MTCASYFVPPLNIHMRSRCPDSADRTNPCLGRRLVESNPMFFDVEAVLEALEELDRLMPGTDVRRMLVQDPSWLTRVERGQRRLGQHPD